MKPTFLCIGAQKGGTTSLINYINLHPELYMHPQELHFFDSTTYNPNRIGEYESKFKTDKKHSGEKTPSYGYLRYTIDRIHFHYPDIKLIYIIREPISRAFSQYNMFCHGSGKRPNISKFLSEMQATTNLDISKVSQNIGDKYEFFRGCYIEHIEYILTKFPRENVYIGISEEIRSNKEEEYNKIYEFIGVHRNPINQNKDTHIRPYSVILDKKTAKTIHSLYKPYNERLYQFLGRSIPSWEQYYSNINS